MTESPAAPAPSPGADARARPDGVGVVAYLIFIFVGGLLVFGMARTLVPSAQQHAQAPCRSLTPKNLDVAAPELKLETLDGKATSLEALKGKFVVLNFWGTFCEPCIDEWPALDTLARRLEEAGADDVEVIAVSLDGEKAEIEPFLKRMSLTESGVKVLWDETGKGNLPFGDDKVPDTYFVTHDGKLQRAFINVRRWGRPDAFRCVMESAEQSRRKSGS